MAQADDIVFEISGRAHMNCYEALCRAVEITYEQLPAQPSMKELTAAVAPRLKPEKTARSVSRALARATEDAWENGGRAVLEEKYGFHFKPSPKELIFKLARAMGNSVEYRLWQEPASGKYSILAREPGQDNWMAATPFLLDEDKAAAILLVLNRSYMNPERFQELLFDGGFAALTEGDFAP